METEKNSRCINRGENMKELYIKMPDGEDRVFKEGECGTAYRTIKKITKITNNCFVIEYKENYGEIIFLNNTPVVFIKTVECEKVTPADIISEGKNEEKTEELECASAKK